ncbi:MAG: ABC transporter permease [Synergistaceae bacterium]|jgi:ribose transport system permease protein|nr:ABC transporter permease [Synergistaceae bacterium]
MNLKKFLFRHSAVIITYTAAFSLLMFVSVARPGYSSLKNLNILSVTAAILGFTVLGQTFVILTGGMDLSIPWMFALSAFLMASLTNGKNEPLYYVIPLVLLVGAGMGFVNGFGVAYIGVAPVIMTMSTNIIFQGLLLGFTGGMPGGKAPDALRTLANGTTGGLSTLFLLWLLISAAGLLVFYKTPFGRNIYAVGCNEKVALFSGINVKRTRLAAYSICGLTAALGGILYSGRLGQLYLGMGDTYQMQSVAAAAIGGISLAGGKGSYVGAVAGVLILVILDGFLSAMNIPPSVQKIVYGGALFMAVFLSAREYREKIPKGQAERI